MSKKRTAAERIRISLTGNTKIQFYTKAGTLLARGYERVVIGARGPYIEFNVGQIFHDKLYVPSYAKHKLGDEIAYYDEYRTKDASNVKLYCQKNTVSYADYKIGKWYIDPNQLKTDEFQDLVLPLYQEEQVKEETNIFTV